MPKSVGAKDNFGHFQSSRLCATSSNIWLIESTRVYTPNGICWSVHSFLQGLRPWPTQTYIYTVTQKHHVAWCLYVTWYFCVIVCICLCWSWPWALHSVHRWGSEMNSSRINVLTEAIFSTKMHQWWVDVQPQTPLWAVTHPSRTVISIGLPT